MSISIANTANTHTIEYLVNRTNEIATAMSTDVVTTDSNNAVGNVVIDGTLNVKEFTVNTSIRGGNVGTVAVLTVTSNVTIQPASIITLGNSQVNSTSYSVGNSTVNSYVNSTSYSVGNSTVNTSVSTTDIHIGSSSDNVQINSTSVSIGTFELTETGMSGLTDISVGNSTVNATVNSIAFGLANSTASVAWVSPTAAQIAGNQSYFNANGDYVDLNISVDGANSAFNTDLLFMDNVNERVGINTTAPDYKLHVKSKGATANLTVGSFENTNTATDATVNVNLKAGGAVRAAISGQKDGTGSGGEYHISTANSSGNLNEAVRITDTGSVGISASAPGRRLHVNSTSDIVGRIDSTTTASKMAFVASGTTNDTYVSFGAAGNEAIIYAGASERVRVDSTGLVGIGTANPGRQLHVNTSSAIAATFESTHGDGASARFHNAADAENAGIIIRGDTNLGVVSTETGNLVIATGGVNTMFLESGGNVAIGNSTPSYKLDIDGDGGIRVPRGTTAERPATANGVMRYNTDLEEFEGFVSGTTWVTMGKVITGVQMTKGDYDPASITEQLVGLTASQTLTNKTLTSPIINTPNFGASSIDNITEIAAALKTGLDSKLITGTAGTANHLVMWDANGDAITAGSGVPTGGFVGVTQSQTLTNKTLTTPILTTPVINGTVTGTSLAGNDGTLLTGTAGTTDFVAKWNADGDLVDGKILPSGALVGTSDSQTLSSKTLTSAILNTSISGTAFLDTDAMTENSATKVASQQSIKAYTDNSIAAIPTATSSTRGLIEYATTAEFHAGTTNAAVTPALLTAATAKVTLSDAATISWGYSDGIHFQVTLAGNRTLGNPNSVKIGQWRSILVIGNDANQRTLSFGNLFYGDLPALTDIDNNTKRYMLHIFCVDTNWYNVTAHEAA